MIIIVHLQEQNILDKNLLAFIQDEQQDHLENVEKIENELNDVFSKKVQEKVEKLTVIEKEENQKIEKQMQKINLEKEELTYRRENFEREKLNFEQNLAFSAFQRCSDSLGKKKKFLFGMGTLKFGRQ